MPRKNIAPLSTILIVTVLLVSLIGVGFASSPVAAQSTPGDADAYLQDGGTYTQGQMLYRDDLESYELMTLYNDETGEHIYTRRANENGEFYIPTEFNSPSTYRLEGEQSGTVATYTLEPSQSNSGDGDTGTSGMIEFQDYYGDGNPVTEVTVQEATLNEGGFLAVYKNGQFITTSDYLSEGTHKDVTIDISSDPVEELSTIRIAPYKDSNNDNQFDSNDESYWGDDSAKSSLSQYGPEEVPPTEPWGTPNDEETPTDDPKDDDSVFTPGGEDPNSGENGGDNPEGNLPSIPAFLTNPIFLIGGVVVLVFLILGILIARQVMGGTGFEDYDPEEDGEPTEEQDPATTATDSEKESPDPTRVDGTTGPTPTQDGPPGATGATASGGSTSSEEEKGFGGVTPQEDLPTPVQGAEEDSIQSTEEEQEPDSEMESEPEPEETEEDVQPPTPLDEMEESEDEDTSEDNVNEVESETDTELMEEPEPASDSEDESSEVDEGYGPEPDEEVPPQPGMEEDVIDEPVEDETTEAESEPEETEEPESEEPSDAEQEAGMDDTDAIKSEKFVEEAKEDQIPDEPDVEDDTESPSTQYDSTKDPMYGEDTPPAPLHEMEEEEESDPDSDSVEPEETEADIDDSEVNQETTEEESEDDGGLGFFGRLRSGLTPDSPSSEEVVDEEESGSTEESGMQDTEPESEPEPESEEDDILEDIVAEREVEEDEDDKEDKEPSATDLVDGGEDDDDDDPFSNV